LRLLAAVAEQEEEEEEEEEELLALWPMVLSFGKSPFFQLKMTAFSQAPKYCIMIRIEFSRRSGLGAALSGS
jgi:hypothetical protein